MYVSTPFLDFVIQALQQPDLPHVLCLDEMNLAIVEHYFSDFLSAWELQSPIYLHSALDYKIIPAEFRIPPNLFVIGTVNVDESTHSFSRKVLDRSFVLELVDVDYDAYLGRVKTERGSTFVLLVKTLSEHLRPWYLHPGYRSLDEMVAFIEAYSKDVPDETKLFDSQITQKVLPKIAGDERILPALTNIHKILVSHLGTDSSSAKRLDEMIMETKATGICQFWR